MKSSGDNRGGNRRSGNGYGSNRDGYGNGRSSGSNRGYGGRGGNGGFMDWLNSRMRYFTVSDRRYFTFIWSVAIGITFITVVLSSIVTAAQIRKDERAKAEEEATTETTEELELLATYTDAATSTDANEDAWMTMLVSADNPLPDDFELPEFTELRNNQKVDSRIYPELQQMFDDARAEGYSPYITSSYRTYDEQQQQIDAKVTELTDQGKTQEQAVAEAKLLVAQPGESEHQTGLAIDIGSDVSDEDQQAVWDWLKDNSYKYGFIVRYPENKTDITGIDYEPWHLRYVGVEAATEMHESGQCLEEYLALR